LDRQISFLQRRYKSHEVIKDIGSGLNFKRRGFKTILEQLFVGRIKEVVIASADRFSRFGTRDFFEWLFSHFGARLVILNHKKCQDPEEELAEDLLEIITVFSARYYGRRSYKAGDEEDKNISKSSTKRVL
jgi:predicted site-specific integrase-resolvase